MTSVKCVTFRHERFEKDIWGHRINVFYTVGLGEGKTGTVSAAKAIEALYRLMRGLNGGVSLLVYVVRDPRLSHSIRKNYELFYEIFCQKVPIFLVISGLENEEDMEGWSKRNERAYNEEKMTFDGATCITAIRGKRNIFTQEFEESQKVEGLVFDHCFKATWLPPLGGRTSWLGTLIVNNVNRIAQLLNFRPIVIARLIYEALRDLGGMNDEEA